MVIFFMDYLIFGLQASEGGLGVVFRHRGGVPKFNVEMVIFCMVYLIFGLSASEVVSGVFRGPSGLPDCLLINRVSQTQVRDTHGFSPLGSK